MTARTSSQLVVEREPRLEAARLTKRLLQHAAVDFVELRRIDAIACARAARELIAQSQRLDEVEGVVGEHADGKGHERSRDGCHQQTVRTVVFLRPLPTSAREAYEKAYSQFRK